MRINFFLAKRKWNNYVNKWLLLLVKHENWELLILKQEYLYIKYLKVNAKLIWPNEDLNDTNKIRNIIK